MRDESGASIPVEATAVKVQKVNPPTLFPCTNCGKPTRSHKIIKWEPVDGKTTKVTTYLCHGCFLKEEEDDKNERRDDDSNRASEEA